VEKQGDDIGGSVTPKAARSPRAADVVDSSAAVAHVKRHVIHAGSELCGIPGTARNA
jgi:hypothetical protein